MYTSVLWEYLETKKEVSGNTLDPSERTRKFLKLDEGDNELTKENLLEQLSLCFSVKKATAKLAST
jgi:hypothetical protein